MSSYHCPNCGKSLGFGESICPGCKADVTSVWEQASKPKDNRPKIAPGMGGLDENAGSPFPPPSGGINSSPFPPASGDSPFPPAKSSDLGSPFPGANNANPFAPSSNNSSPFPPASGTSPFPPINDNSAPFPPSVQDVTPDQQEIGPHIEIPKIGAKIFIPEGEMRMGRDEIQGYATIALPDLNAYKNISRKRQNSEHFILRRNGNTVSIEDRGSTNGTYMGTDKITGSGERTLKNDDKIVLPIEEHGKMVQLEMIFKTQ